MEWPITNHVLFTSHELEDGSTVYCNCHEEDPKRFDETVKKLGTMVCLKSTEIKDISYEYGDFYIDISFDKRPRVENYDQRRKLDICFQCERKLLWSRVEAIEKALKLVGQVL